VAKRGDVIQVKVLGTIALLDEGNNKIDLTFKSLLKIDKLIFVLTPNNINLKLIYE